MHRPQLLYGAFQLSAEPKTICPHTSGRVYWAGVAADELFEPARAADNLLRVVQRLAPDQGCRCWDWKGDEILP